MARSHAGGPAGTAGSPAKVTSAVPPSMWPGENASPGMGWQPAQAIGFPIPCGAATCDVCVPTRVASPAFPQVAAGGAPPVPSVPPWHIVQSVFQPAPWHCAQETGVEPPTPSSVGPWHVWHAESPAFAEAAA